MAFTLYMLLTVYRSFFWQLRILSNRQESEHFVEPGIESGRVIYSVEERPKRYFNEWYSCVMQEIKSQVDDVSAETSRDVVHDLATNLLEIGKLQSEAVGGGEVELSK